MTQAGTPEAPGGPGPRSLPAGPRRAAPWGLLGMLALVAAGEAAVGRHEFDFSDNALASWKHSAQAARREARDAQVLCFGDSLVQLSVFPRVIEARSGRRAYNLSVTGGPPPASYFLLERALAAGARPAALVVDSKPNILATRHEWLVRHYSHVAGLRDRVALARECKDSGLFGLITAARLLPSYRDRTPIRAAILAAFGGGFSSPREAIAGRWRNAALNKGALVFPKNPAVADEVGPDEQSVYYPPAWSANPASRAYMDRFLALAESRGIPVFWIVPPISPKPQARREALGLDAAFTRFVAGMQARHRNVVVVDGRHAGYHAGLFVDQSHLDREGATTFSVDLAAIIARHLDGPPPADGARWVSLPAFRPVPAGVPLEDIRESAVAAANARGGLRR